MATFQKFLFLGVMLAVAFASGGEARHVIRKSNYSQDNISPLPISVKTDAVNVSSASVSNTLRIFYPISAENPPEVNAQAALVADLKTGEIYFDLNSEKRWPMASITKFMTAAYAMRNMDMNSRITLAVGDFPLYAGDAFKGLKPGDTYLLKDLLQAVLLSSSNEAAEAIANSYGRNNFIAGLINMAKEWDMTSTYFADPTGLSAANQSNARDLRIMALKIYETYPGILKTTRQKNSVITEIVSGRREMLTNINLFAGESWFLGGKTGYTDEAGGNLLTLINHDNRPVAVVVLGTIDRFGDTEKLVNWFRHNYRLNEQQRLFNN